jgi:hypothetical protein
MASKSNRAAASIGQVRIPGPFLTNLDKLFHSLLDRIVENAVGQAFARKSGPMAGIVVLEDLVTAAELLMPQAVPELQNLLKPYETSHARREAS